MGQINNSFSGMTRKFLFLSLLLVGYCLFAAEVFPQHSEQEVHIEWDGLKMMPYGEDQHLELLYFQGAVYADTMPAVPLYTFRIRDHVPHFSHGLHVVGKRYVPMSEAEQAVLISSGFDHSEPVMVLSEQWERTLPYRVLSFYPFRHNAETGEYERLVSFSIEMDLHFDPAKNYDKAQTYASSSVLTTGAWAKVCLEHTGIYRLNYSDLEELGLPMQGLQKNQIRLFGNGGGMLPEANSAFRHDDLVENAIHISGTSEGSFGQNDYILFYAQSPNKWYFNPGTGYFDHEVHAYANENCYFLTIGQGPGKRITAQPSVEESVTHHVTNFLDYAYHQRDLISLIGSGRIWYGEVYETTLNRDFTFDFPDIDNSMPARVKASVAARSPVVSSFQLRSGGQEQTVAVPAVNLLDYNNFYARDTESSLLFTPDNASQVRVTLNYNRPVSTARGWLDYIAVNVYRNLRFSGSQMLFRNPGVAGMGHVAAYTLSNASAQVVIWDVTDRFNVKRQEASSSGNSLVFRVQNGQIKEFVAFSGSSFPKPRLVGRVDNQNLHALQSTDMIIVSPEKFIPEAKRLADFRLEHDGLASTIVTPQQIYNEFSSGVADVSAIRNFMKMFHDRAFSPTQMPRYLLLFGNGTIDNKNNLGFGGNLIPTYQSLASLSPSNSFMTDDYFGLLADNEGEQAAGLLDIGIGRLPVRTEEEARSLVDKIIRYDKRVDAFHPLLDDPASAIQVSNYADWRNMVVFIADDGDFNTHFNHAERLTDIVRLNHPSYNLEKIYLDAYQLVTLAGGSRYPDVNRAINDRVNKGALLINYIGHGGVRGLAHERVVTYEDIATWNNFYNMPVFMTATCEFSSFDQPDPDELSAGVRILLKPDGGAVALYTTTRLAWSGTNLTLNENFTRNVFRRDESGEFPRLGDLIRIAKVESDGNVQPWRLKNFVLLGDPSMQMAYPQYQIITESLPDTIKAFQRVTVTGYIADADGNKVNDYNGVLYPTVYDKYNTFETLANATGSNKSAFNTRNSTLYRGKAGISNGSFSFSFIVPKDIAYNFDRGKISYYTDDGQIDGHGYYTGFTVGGTKQSFDADNEGPEISLYMNDTTFISGGTTNENPVLLAFVSDQSGINISGRIGHDIVAYLNDQLSQPIALNSYYEANMDSYQRGRIVYPFINLDDGHHTLSLRVWDVHNNPSVASIDFYVVRSARMILENLFNYPNPLGHQGTNFRFTHNLPGQDLDVEIGIYDLSGRQLKRLQHRVQSGGYSSPPIFWDGYSDGGHMLGNGVYVYRVIVSTPDGRNSQQTEKLFIVRD